MYYNFLEKMIAIYIVLAMIVVDSIYVSYLDIVLSFSIQLLIIIMIFRHKESIVLSFQKSANLIISVALYLFTISYLIFSTLFSNDAINRSATLASIIGLVVLIGLSGNFLNRINIINTSINLFFYLGLFIIFDSAIYITSGTSFWPPISYLGMRFSGPFYDPNFLSFTYSMLIIIHYSLRGISKNKDKFMLSTFLVLLVLSSSWTSIILLLISFIFKKVYVAKNMIAKQISFLILYGLLIQLFLKFNTILKDIFVSNPVLNIFFFPEELYAKYLSLEYRVFTQYKALEAIENNFFGYGPQTIVPYLGRDTHNSFVGISFELGIIALALILILINFKINKSFNYIGNIVTTYFILMSFVLNTHYTSMFLLLYIVLSFVNHTNSMNNRLEKNNLFNKEVA